MAWICDKCWQPLPDANGGFCIDMECQASRPTQGWPELPYLFRERYEFIEILGRGGMGAVFLAYDRQTKEADRRVAIKVVQTKGDVSHQSQLRRLFGREAAAAALLSSYAKHFVKVFGHDTGEPAYVALEFVGADPQEGWSTLATVLNRSGVLLPVDVARIGVALLSGVRAMETLRIVHRDLKPENIFVRRFADGSFVAKISDLGLWEQAETSAAGSMVLTRLWSKAGTPDYMSPEQVSGDPLTTASDVYATGSILWELATSSPPYPCAGDKHVHVALAERRVAQSSPVARPPTMPEKLYDILLIALQEDPAKRNFAASHRVESSAHGMEMALRQFYVHFERDEQQEFCATLDRSKQMLVDFEAKFWPWAPRAVELQARLVALCNSQPGPDARTEDLRALAHGIEIEIATLVEQLPKPPEKAREISVTEPQAPRGKLQPSTQSRAEQLRPPVGGIAPEIVSRAGQSLKQSEEVSSRIVTNTQVQLGKSLPLLASLAPCDASGRGQSDGRASDANARETSRMVNVQPCWSIFSGCGRRSAQPPRCAGV